MFRRLELLIGPEKLAILQQKTVLIVGLGGVGGNAAEAIARSGFGRILLVDQDVVEPSNINRQLVARSTTLGKPKVDVMEQRIVDINPNCDVVTYHTFYDYSTKDTIWDNDIDYIIDCIDTITYKIDIIQEAHKRGIPMISVMGTGNKYQPEQLTIMRLSKTEYDPIARVIRHKLRHQLNLKDVIVIASKEVPQKPLQETSSPASNAFVPNTAGILAASYIFRIAIGETVTLS
ncbi:tRNA threonylcarbamoyladenosine dehydratase [Candidatus Xianfuyuplasma coldseepsis]|uniref:tRNA threonylcarbamoyladenosine dehydratase n=1 Tax=Candidatus Xianfuyuplasma coldseepsis TaxID=2782163 RepID=A0A7L7KV62_9MOLU|nr:ThiF family adenylyltransferase [Xianfuyuplasma coldseepsis]QMS85884.1 tRNA threonylcarbamoyladenosine dehydratase [Xianfuyuplasma coldseepsis]